jgi:UDP-GlcNAc:undecaprenyl-phosphate GlcNAc-1-phosphate transferase
VRLVGEVTVGMAVVATCPLHAPGWLSAVALIPLTVLLINGVNLMDGLDMLAAGVTAVAAVGFAIVTHGSPRQTAVALAAALGGFLWFNRPPAKVYLGDGGSYLLGTALAVLLASTWAPHLPVATGTAALALVALPSAEVAFAVVRRLRGRLSLVSGDRRHPYDRLVTRGWPRPAASGAYIGAEAVLAVAAVIAAHRSSLAVAVVVDVAAAVTLTILAGAVGALAPDSEVPS